METGDVWKACDLLMMLIKARSEAGFRWTTSPCNVMDYVVVHANVKTVT